MTAESRTRPWRYASILLFCGLPLLLIGLVVSNLIKTTEAGGEAAREGTTLAQIVSRVARHRARTLTATDKASLYLASTTGTLARAEIQDRAAKLVAQAGGRLEEAQLLGTPEQEAEGSVAIQLTLEIDNKGLFDLLYDIETGLPLLEVTDLSVSRNDGQSGGDQPVPATNGPGRLRVELTVLGHWRKATG